MEIINPIITGSLLISASFDITNVLSASSFVGIVSGSSQIDYELIKNKPQESNFDPENLQYLNVTGSMFIAGNGDSKYLNLNGYSIYRDTVVLTDTPSFIDLIQVPENSTGVFRVQNKYSDVSKYEYRWVYTDDTQTLDLVNSLQGVTSSLSFTIDTGSGIIRSDITNYPIEFDAVLESFSNTNIQVLNSVTESLLIEYLVVAGGGGGGGVIAGGGGAGGLLQGYVNMLSDNLPVTYSISIGAGGNGGNGYNTSTNDGKPGSNSSFSSITANGGGGGAYYPSATTTGVKDGGSGGGATANVSFGLGIPGQGNNGGGVDVVNYNNSGGGGGAGSVGANSVNNVSSGNGGIGLYLGITGVVLPYAGGGGGGTRNGYGIAGTGGSTVGGDGTTSTVTAGSGIGNSGGGGGGGGYHISSASRIGGNGGSGIVVLRFLTKYAAYLVDAGLTFYENFDGDYTVLTFTAGTGNISFVKLPFLSFYDRYYDNVSLLLHMSGSDGSTSFIDDSVNNFTVSVFGNTQIDTGESKYGGSSAYFDGSGDYLTVPASNVFSFDTNFTIEGWIKTSTFAIDTQYRRVIATGTDASTSIQLLFFNGSAASSNLSVYSNAMLITGTIPAATGEWVHFALSRVGTSLKLFINGVQSGSTANTSTNFSGGGTNGVTIGKYPGASGHFLGYMDDIRITKGIGRYFTNFVPPSREYPDNEFYPYSMWDGGQTSLLDTYSGAAVAYSLRALSSEYTGPMIRVRRSSDNLEADIYALADGGLDTTKLSNFCGLGNGFVSIWYDQSGNGRHATQTTLVQQPRIYTSGVVVTTDGKPAISWPDYSQNYWLRNNSFNFAQPNTVFTALYFNGASGRQDYVFDTGGSTTRTLLYHDQSSNKWGIYNGTTLSEATADLTARQLLFTQLHNSTTSVLRKNGTQTAAGNAGTQTFAGITIGNYGQGPSSAYNHSGTIYEIIIYDSNKTADFVGIETNINEYYTIF